MVKFMRTPLRFNLKFGLNPLIPIPQFKNQYNANLLYRTFSSSQIEKESIVEGSAIKEVKLNEAVVKEPDTPVIHRDYVTQEEFEMHDGSSGRFLYILVNGNVYDVTHFKHPGGKEVFFQNRLTDKIENFSKIESHKKVPQSKFDSYLVGPLRKL